MATLPLSWMTQPLQTTPLSSHLAGPFSGRCRDDAWSCSDRQLVRILLGHPPFLVSPFRQLSQPFSSLFCCGSRPGLPNRVRPGRLVLLRPSPHAGTLPRITVHLRHWDQQRPPNVKGRQLATANECPYGTLLNPEPVCYLLRCQVLCQHSILLIVSLILSQLDGE
jgi:hypothetical protein